MKVPSEQKAGIPTSIRSGSCSFLCAANAMSSYCVLEQCYCGPELHFEDVPEETAEEEEANIAHDVSVFPIMLPSHLLSLNSTQGCIYIYIYAFMVLARPGAVTVGSRGNAGGSPV